MMGLKTVFVAPLGKVLKNGKGVLLSTYFNFNVNFFNFKKNHLMREDTFMDDKCISAFLLFKRRLV